MPRCPHCNKLTHSENLQVFFKMEDFEKVKELFLNPNWLFYRKPDDIKDGYLKCGDIKIHFNEMEKPIDPCPY